jgi:hypothetical protein
MFIDVAIVLIVSLGFPQFKDNNKKYNHLKEI